MKLKVFWSGITKIGNTFVTSFQKTFFFFLILQNGLGHFPIWPFCRRIAYTFSSSISAPQSKNLRKSYFLYFFSSCFSISTAINCFVDSFDLVINRMPSINKKHEALFSDCDSHVYKKN